MFSSIPQKGYRIPQRSIGETNRVTRGYNDRAYGIAYRIRVYEDLGNIWKVRNMEILIPQKEYRIPQERKNEL